MAPYKNLSLCDLGATGNQNKLVTRHRLLILPLRVRELGRARFVDKSPVELKFGDQRTNRVFSPWETA
jgi:hypothetical protein